MENVLEVRNLSVSFDSPKGEVQAVRDVSFSLHKGEVLAIVGESGCGKSVLCKSIMKLLPKTARIKEGSIRVMGTDITGYKEKEMQKIRGKIFSMIFQDPMTSLNPTMKIGQQIAEAILIHDKRKTKEQVYKKVLELMELVGIEHAQERYHSYPYNFSGGMRQRSVMAIALASDPDILFADEPTTALDVTIQAQILDLLGEIQKKMGTSTILVSHDLGVVARTAAGTYAMTLQCEEGGTEPCGHCDSCKKAIGKNHPDIIMVTHEKPNVITIDEIREQIINDVDIKPYCSPYKIYIVANAELMNPQAQNALLKTIEEPPEYAVIMLLTSNIDALLPTIRSRCVRLDLKVVDDGLVKKYLMEHLHIPDYQAEIDASYAHGSIGRAKQVATSQEFADMTQNALRILKNADGMEVYELTEAIKELSNDKQNISDYLDLFQFWFRDVLMFKATREVDNLVFKQEINYIREQASQRSYENLEKILDALEKTKVRLRANVNTELALELLFLTIREK